MTDLRQAAEMALEAMKQALDALNTTDTHPISSAEQYLKEIEAMEALEDAAADAQEREWVGLTDDDRKNFYQGKYVISDDDLMDAVEAKLREKNHGTMGKMESN